MGNQQERLIWLAGFIDGDGSISLVEQHSGRRKEGRHITPRVLMANVNVPALRYIEKILDKYEMAYYVGWKEPHRKGSFPGSNKWVWTIQIAGAKRVNRFLELILPYLVIKAPQAAVVHDWTKWVVTRPRNTKQNRIKGKSTNLNKYLKEDRKVKEVISKLNQNPQRLYAEHENKYIREDIVRSEVKASEVGGNDLPPERE